MKTLSLRLLLSLLALACITVTAPAQDLGAVRVRMSQRLPKIDELKSSGALGENNRGLLEVRSAGGDAASVSADENNDRGTVYAALAKQTGASAEAVGRARAKQIAQNSAAGVWLQDESGNWYKK
ncbi:MAG: YdbL family protein [Opitutaceae bacterium]|nr:YdbL family protein [Opitutaceae bacterium]MBP9914376.1 YdbL family protein [Opitutaceae bacterium]